MTGILLPFTLRAIVDMTYKIYTRQMRKSDLFKQNSNDMASFPTWINHIQENNGSF
jgi:hypothetical protein